MARRDGSGAAPGDSAAMHTSQHPSGTGLLVLMSGATILVTAIIAVSLAAGSWLMLPVALLSVAAGAACVLIGIARSLADDGEDTALR